MLVLCLLGLIAVQKEATAKKSVVDVDFKEVVDLSVGYVAGKGVKDLVLHSAKVDGSGIRMRTTAEKGSLVNFLNKNNNKEWSFEANFVFPRLITPQLAGVYLWYTKSQVQEGNFKGGNADFNGMVAGIEMLGRSVEIVVAANDGKKEESDEKVLLRDSIAHERFSGIDKFSLKIVSTKNNFRVEVHNGDEIVYDKLRFREAPLLGDIGEGGYFSISTVYERTPIDKKIIISEVKLHSREEGKKYDPLHSQTKSIEKEPRMFTEILHGDSSTRHLISSLEHYIKYIRTLVGTPVGIPIATAITNMREEADNQSQKLEEIKKILEILPTKDHANTFDDVSFRMGGAEDKLKGINKGIKKLSEMVVELERRNSVRNKIVGFAVVAASIAVIFAVVLSGLKRKISVI